MPDDIFNKLLKFDQTNFVTAKYTSAGNFDPGMFELNLHVCILFVLTTHILSGIRLQLHMRRQREVSGGGPEVLRLRPLLLLLLLRHLPHHLPANKTQPSSENGKDEISM